MQSELLPQGLCTYPCPLLERSSLKTCSLPLLTSQFCHPGKIFPDLCLRHHPSLYSLSHDPDLAFIWGLITPLSYYIFDYNPSPLLEFKFWVIKDFSCWFQGPQARQRETLWKLVKQIISEMKLFEWNGVSPILSQGRGLACWFVFAIPAPSPESSHLEVLDPLLSHEWMHECRIGQIENAHITGAGWRFVVSNKVCWVPE